MGTYRPVALLDPIVSERIAAGEVVERPASIVKEALENALDAGATEIHVALKDGGRTLIQITDNGHGMSPHDLELSVHRHATSKIRAVEDLNSLLSLGFRGEALPSIVASAELHLISRTATSDSAYELHAHAQDPHPKATAVTHGTFNGTEHGTQLSAKALFSQIPARLKFLKSPRAENQATREWIEKLALTRPDVGFTLELDDEEVLNLRPTEEKQRILELLADGQSLPIESESFRSLELGINLRLYWIQGLSLQSSRKIMSSVNGRVLRDRLIQSALLSPFRQHLLPGQFPALALFMEMDPAQLDVNIHPTKTEVRFLENQKIFHLIDSLGSKLIRKVGMFAHVPSSEPSQTTHSQPLFTQRFQQPSQTFDLGLPPTPSPTPMQSQSLFKPAHLLSDARFVGQVFSTYWLFEKPTDAHSELVAVDQHAAHERIRYEKLKKAILSSERPASQNLLMPVSLKLTREDLRIFSERSFLLTNMGFDCEAFGENALLFRSIPSFWGDQDLEARLKNLMDRVMSLESNEVKPNMVFDEALFEKIASEACRSAIKAGDHVDTFEIQSLLDELFRCENPWNCPHGRPCILKIPRARFEEWFQRRV